MLCKYWLTKMTKAIDGSIFKFDYLLSHHSWHILKDVRFGGGECSRCCAIVDRKKGNSKKGTNHKYVNMCG